MEESGTESVKASKKTKSPAPVDAVNHAASTGGNGGAAAAQTASHAAGAKAKFSKALEEAKAGVGELGKEAQERAHAYRAGMEGRTRDWNAEARAYGEQARDKVSGLASEGKVKASGALNTLGRAVADTAPMIDEKIGAKYGDYARSAARQIEGAAAKLDAKSVDELTEDAREFVRKSPGVAVGLAAAAGFMLSRLIGGGKR